MYGDDDEYNSRRDSRPLSFIPAGPNEIAEEANHQYNHQNRSSSLRSTSNSRPQATINGHAGNRSHTLPMMPNNRDSPYENGPSIRDHSPLSPGDTAHAQFPLNDVDYESSPAAVAQELSNLQALRRMSMDVGNASDPDLPSFQGMSLMPTVAPTGTDNEDDPSRLFWVPARVHPELAPMEFKTFLENRVNSIKRRSGDLSTLTSDNLERSGSNASLSTVGSGGLSRKKSMLSRQIDNSGGRGAAGYQDGADRLGRKKSLSLQQTLDLKISDLEELDALVRDPSKAVKSLSIDTSNRIQQAGVDVAEQSEDLPILPSAPGGMALRRSTHTTYRRGSLRRGERVPFSKRVGNRAGAIAADTDNEDSPISPSSAITAVESPLGSPLTKVVSEPTPENFSRPTRGSRRGAKTVEPVANSNPPSQGNFDDIFGNLDKGPTVPLVPSTILAPAARQNSFPKDHEKSSTQRSEIPVPKIVETPPVEEHSGNVRGNQVQQQQFPQRTSSQASSASTSNITPAPQKEPPARSAKRPVVRQDASSPITHKANVNQTFEQMSQHPSPLPGGNARTDSLTIIPTLSEDKKSEKKRTEKEDSGSRKTSWAWFKGSDDKDKKEKKKDENSLESKRGKAKVVVDKSHENSRLDVLQNSIDGAIVRGRESLLLDRESIDNKLVEERKKESSRKSSEHKKEKDGLFSSIFGGKKKADRDSGPKKGSSLRTLSPEPPRVALKPDVDYPWTRFSIMQERAIYRMAHIKLANPKRALQSQVLLSNFSKLIAFLSCSLLKKETISATTKMS